MPTQCVSTAVIGTAFCVKRCSSERLARDLAFFPPEPPSYALGTSERGELRAIANEEHVPATYARSVSTRVGRFSRGFGDDGERERGGGDDVRSAADEDIGGERGRRSSDARRRELDVDLLAR